MGEVLREITVITLSSAAAAANSKPVRVGGNLFDVQISEPAAVTLVTIQGSQDKSTWSTATDIAGTALSGIGVSYHAGIREGFKWVRVQVATDAGGPRNFVCVLVVHKQGD